MIKPVTLITGSTNGIGLQIGLDLLKKDHHVIFVGKNWKHIHELKFLLNSNYALFSDYTILNPIDLSNKTNIMKLQKQMVEKFTRIDNLILNVGKTCRIKFEDLSMKNWNDILNTNLTNSFFLIQQLKSLIQKRIIFIGSVSGHIPDSSSIPYGVSKGGLEILTKYLAKEFAPNVTVNTIAPGYILTNWHDNKPKDQIERIKNKILLKRFGTTKEISNACQFIIETEYINGQILCIDGGFNFD